MSVPIERMSWAQMVESLLYLYAESEEGMIQEYSGYIETDLAVLRVEIEAYIARARQLNEEVRSLTSALSREAASPSARRRTEDHA